MTNLRVVTVLAAFLARGDLWQSRPVAPAFNAIATMLTGRLTDIRSREIPAANLTHVNYACGKDRSGQPTDPECERRRRAGPDGSA